MRKPIMAGNWKMNKNIDDAESLVMSLKPLVKDALEVEVVIAPPYIALSVIAPLLIGTNIKLCAQDMYYEDSGAFTGEISPKMLLDVGCDYVILGHSERRWGKYISESDEFINKKVKAALKNGLTPILCIGESLAQREENKTFELVESQLKSGLDGIESSQAAEIVIAYEPIWAIGTGKNATKEQAGEVHSFIRAELLALFGKEVSALIRILYGGSVKPDNIDELMSEDNIDGALVGGASLTADSFARIVNFK